MSTPTPEAIKAMEAFEEHRQRRSDFQRGYYAMTMIADVAFVTLAGFSLPVVQDLTDHPVKIAVIVLAAVRASRAVVKDSVFAWLRDALHYGDASEVADEKLTRIGGMRHAIETMVNCLICSGTWAALVVANMCRFLPGLTLSVFLALAALVEISNYIFNDLHQR